MSVRPSRIRLVARREWLQKIRRRSFIIATIVQIVIVLGLILAPVALSAIFGGDEGTSTEEVLIVNRTDQPEIVADTVAFIAHTGLGDQIELRAAPGDTDAVRAIEAGDADAVLEIERGADGALAFTYTDEDGATDQTAVVIQALAGELALRDQLVRIGVDPEQAREVRSLPNMVMQAVGEAEADNAETEQGFRYGVAYVAALVMYMVVLIYGMWVAQGGVEEKSSRIMEIMINAASPTELMYGKIIGIGLAGLTQILPTLAIAGIGLYSQEALADALDATGIHLSGIDFGAISVQLVGFFLIYFLLGFLLYAALYAGVGSLVSRQEDVQTVMAPMTFTVVLGFFGALFTLGAPDSIVAQVVSIFPFTSPLAMVPRILLGDPELWEILLSIALLAVSGYLAVRLAARIYRMGVLMYGQKPSLKVIFRPGIITAAR
ncbi:MAG TPA: ABC transporter permease [Thermomicrobiales bacterium]|nr:ABC transporter permease [Thermomicrobiales bacterium]